MAGTSKKTTVISVRVPNELMVRLKESIIPLGAKNQSEVFVNAIKEYLK